MLETFAVVATWDDAAERVRARYDGLLDRVGFYRPFVAGVDESKWAAVIDRMK
jgi:hypothetical protein